MQTKRKTSTAWLCSPQIGEGTAQPGAWAHSGNPPCPRAEWDQSRVVVKGLVLQQLVPNKECRPVHLGSARCSGRWIHLPSEDQQALLEGTGCTPPSCWPGGPRPAQCLKPMVQQSLPAKEVRIRWRFIHPGSVLCLVAQCEFQGWERGMYSDFQPFFNLVRVWNILQIFLSTVTFDVEYSFSL